MMPAYVFDAEPGDDLEQTFEKAASVNLSVVKHNGKFYAKDMAGRPGTVSLSPNITYTPAPTMTVNDLIAKLQVEVGMNPDVGNYDVWSADDCTSVCDTEATRIQIDPSKRRLTVGG